MEDTDENIELILAQWQTCVEMANTVSQRRDAMNNIFITLNLAIITAVSVTWELKSLLVLTAGIVTCVLWHFFIRNYKELNTEKFRVINTLEGKLPVKPFHDEWNRLKENEKYMDGTKLEMVLPIAFAIIYIVAIILILAQKLKHQEEWYF